MEHWHNATQGTDVICGCGWRGSSLALFDAHMQRFSPGRWWRNDYPGKIVPILPEHFPLEWNQWVPPPRPRRPVLADEIRRLAARLDGPEYLGRERLAEIAGSLRTVAVILDGEPTT